MGESGRGWERSEATGNLLVYNTKEMENPPPAEFENGSKDFAIIYICCVKKCAGSEYVKKNRGL